MEVSRLLNLSSSAAGAAAVALLAVGAGAAGTNTDAYRLLYLSTPSSTSRMSLRQQKNTGRGFGQW